MNEFKISAEEQYHIDKRKEDKWMTVFGVIALYIVPIVVSVTGWVRLFC